MRRRPEGWEAYRSQRQMAKTRDILFLFTFEQWWAWWQVDGRWANRGRHKGGYVMARRGDQGPYSPDNVYCATVRENAAEKGRLMTAEERAALSVRFVAMHAARPEIASHLRDRPNHPMRKAVRTPYGTFPSCALAGEALGYTRQRISQLARSGQPGWGYSDDAGRGDAGDPKGAWPQPSGVRQASRLHGRSGAHGAGPGERDHEERSGSGRGSPHAGGEAA